MRPLKASELGKHDVALLTPGTMWVVTTEVEVVGPLATFRARMYRGAGQGWEDAVGLALPANSVVDVEHAWRDVGVRCMLCQDLYPHRMDVAVASDPRGSCGACNVRTSMQVLTDRECST